jgi:plasmid stabilization system protein ParE
METEETHRQDGSKRVVLSRTSIRQLDQLHAYIQADHRSDEPADDVIHAILDRIALIPTISAAYPPHPFLHGYRRAICMSWFINFVEFESEIRIMTIEHMSRMPK